MPTRNVVPRANEEGMIGTSIKRWLKAWFRDVDVSGTITDGTHSHAVADLRDALKIKGIEIDDAGIGDGRVLEYVASSGKIEYRTCIDYDRQQANATDAAATTSVTYIDLPNMVLTTAAGATRTYLINFSCQCENTNADKVAYFALVIDGATVMERASQTNKSPLPNTVAFSWLATVAPEKVIKIQFRTDANTLTVRGRTLSIWGEG